MDWGIAPTPAELASALTLGAMELTRLLVRLLHLPRRAWADEDAMGLRSVLEHAYAHEDEWVRLLATVLDRYHATGVVLADTDGLLHVARQVATVVARPQTESQGGSFVQPLRSSELAFTLLRDQPASAAEHFKVSPVTFASLETDFRLAEPAAASSGTFAATASTRTDAASSAVGTSRASSSEADRPSILLSGRAARPVTLGRASGLSAYPGQAKKEKPKVMMVDVQELTKLQAAAEAKKKADKEAKEAAKQAEKEAAEAKKKAEKEAAEAKKRAEKEAMETKKRAEKEAAEAEAKKETPKPDPKEPQEPKKPKVPRAKKPKLDAAATGAFGIAPDAGAQVGDEEGVGSTASFGIPPPPPPPLPWPPSHPAPHPAQVVPTAASPFVLAFAPPPPSAFAPPTAPPLVDAVLPEAVPEVLRDALRGLGADDLALVVAFFRQDAGRTGAHEIVLSTETKEDGTLSHVMLKLDFGSMSWKRVRRKA